MRVKAPGDGPPPIPAVDETQAAEPTAASTAVTEVAPPSPVAGPAGTAAVDPIAEVARQLKAGEISAADAVALLIDEVVERQTGPLAGDRHAIADELKAILREQIESDPYLASRVRRLGNRT